jgi:hypothetical protein
MYVSVVFHCVYNHSHANTLSGIGLNSLLQSGATKALYPKVHSRVCMRLIHLLQRVNSRVHVRWRDEKGHMFVHEHSQTPKQGDARLYEVNIVSKAVCKA